MPRAPKRCQKCNLLVGATLSPCRCPKGWSASKSPPVGGNWKRLSRVVREHSGMHCANCGRYDPKGEVDHKMNRARGGTDELKNLQFLCRSCHRIKTAMERRWGRK